MILVLVLLLLIVSVFFQDWKKTSKAGMCHIWASRARVRIALAPENEIPDVALYITIAWPKFNLVEFTPVSFTSPISVRGQMKGGVVSFRLFLELLSHRCLVVCPTEGPLEYLRTGIAEGKGGTK